MKNIPSVLIDKALADIVKLDASFESGVARRVLTFEEAVEGVNGEAYLGGLNMASSPGVPLINTKTYKEGIARGLKGKRPFFPTKEDGTVNFSAPEVHEVRSIVDNILSLAKDNIRSEELATYVGSLKSELRPMEKVRTEKTRLFAAGPLALMICSKMYNGAWVAHQMKGRPNIETQVGVNAYGEWHELEQWMDANGDNWLALDFKDYDGSANKAVLSTISTRSSAWYCGSKEDERVRDVLNEYNTSAHWSLDGYHVLMDKTLPSGLFLTAIGNSHQGAMLWRIVYMILKARQGKAEECDTFKDHCALANYGDDVCGTVDDDIKDWYNGETIASTLRDYGYTITGADKSLIVPKFIDKHDATFLKRSFRKRDGIPVAPLDKATIERIPMWRHSTSPLDHQEDLRNRIRGSQIEAWAHGPDYFIYFTVTVRDKLRELGFPDYTLSDAACRDFWFTQWSKPTVVTGVGKPFGAKDIASLYLC